MAQAVVLQNEILAKDVSVIDAAWIETIRGLERYQGSYSTKIHELIEMTKRRPSLYTASEPLQAGEANVKANEDVPGKSQYNDINKG